MSKSIVVYGSTMAGVAAAAKAAKNANNAVIHLIVPDPVDHNGNGCCLGAIGTVGGQNFFDIGWKRVNGEKIYFTKGSFKWWSNDGDNQFYSVDDMAALLKSDLTKAEYQGKIQIHYGYDITKVNWTSPARILSVNLKQIKREESTGDVVWEDVEKTIYGDVFIDASESGRLTRLSNFGGTVGRYDWPADKLDSDERGSSGKARQQAASLMFKVSGFNMEDLREDLEVGKGHPNGVCSATGGKDAYKDKNRKIYQFNEKYGPTGFAIKPFNMAQDGPNDTEWWVNALLVFNVDGRAYNRDKGTSIFPSDMRADYKTVDDRQVGGPAGFGPLQVHQVEVGGPRPLKLADGVQGVRVVYRHLVVIPLVQADRLAAEKVNGRQEYHITIPPHRRFSGSSAQPRRSSPGETDSP